MIKFFRKIRRQLLTENRFSKYLLYAIGEIVLVVIGILIALQINIWNENRKATVRTEELLVNVQKELALNIKNANIVIDFYRGKDSIIYKVLNKKATYNDYKNNSDYKNLLKTSMGKSIVDNAFISFIDSFKSLSIKQDSMVIKLKELYGVNKKNVTDSDLSVYEALEKYINKLLEEKGWFSKYYSFNEISDEMIDYFLKDPYYMNNASNYEVLCLRNHNRFTIDFRNKAIQIYEQISEELDLKKDTLIVKNLKDYQHYIGTYDGEDSLYSLSIMEENNELIAYTLKYQDTTVLSKVKIYPDSKTYFTVGPSFGQFIFDKTNKVNGIIASNGTFRIGLKKVK